jgi:small subunit ribosomal protein S8
MSVDTIGDFLTTIRNGIQASASVVEVPYARLKYEIALILKDEGFIRDAVIVGEGQKRTLKIFLKYVGKESAIHALKRISKPGRRVYQGYRTVSPVIGGLGIAIITTSKGIMTDKKARLGALGGEILCTVW